MMKQKQFKLVATMFIMILLFVGSAHFRPLNESGIGKSGIVNKTYTYENDGFGSDFTIQINQDGTFEYCVGKFSSYIGHGQWTLEDDILTLCDDTQAPLGKKNYFKIDEDDHLVFMAENSTNFTSIEVADGEKFISSSTEES